MCGLLALASWGGPAHRDRAEAALARMQHRGPDGVGLEARWDGRLLLGHRRLAIFDPGAGGHQPMVCPNTGSCVAFNGAIYNYREIRAELRERGHSFRSNSDTEVVLAAWREWGRAAFQRFNGIWAIALHDAESNRLYLCRDRLGVKPLYFLSGPKVLVAASEVRAVVAAAGLAVEIDPDVAFDYLTMGLTDHRGATMVRGVVEIPAGGLWSVAADGVVERASYHHWPDSDGSLSSADAAALLPDLIRDATALRLRADVPVAAHLSGGLDSGAVAWGIGQCRDASAADPFIGFFSYGYAGAEAARFDECDAARATIDHVAPAAPHHLVRCSPVPGLDELDDLVWAQELPVSTPSTLAGWRLYRAMRQAGAKVALTGDGSDELFSGYTRRYLPIAFRDALRQGCFAQAGALLRSPHFDRRAALSRLAWQAPLPLMRHLSRRNPHVAALSDGYWGESAERFQDLRDLQRQGLDRQGRDDVQRVLLPQILRHSDRNAMAWGVEARAPFLDYRIAELAMRLPAAAKVGPQGGKMPVRLAMRGKLPQAVVEGAKARGLGHAEQFQIGRMDLGALFESRAVADQPFIHLPRLRAALAKTPDDSRLWWPICFLLWLRQLDEKWR